MQSSPEVLIKATPFGSARGYIEELLTPEARERVMAKLSAEFPDRAGLLRQRVIVATERMPVMLLDRLITLSASELRESPAALGLRIGHRYAAESANGVLRLAMVMISIPTLLRKLVPLWSQTYTHGKMSSTSEGRHATVELAEFPFVSAAGCARVTGVFEWFGQRAEKNIAVRHVSCTAAGGSVCRWDVKW